MSVYHECINRHLKLVCKSKFFILNKALFYTDSPFKWRKKMEKREKGERKSEEEEQRVRDLSILRKETFCISEIYR